MLDDVRRRLTQRAIRRAYRSLETADPEELARTSGRDALRALARASRAPYYRQLLEQAGVDPRQITNLANQADFQNVRDNFSGALSKWVAGEVLSSAEPMSPDADTTDNDTGNRQKRRAKHASE